MKTGTNIISERDQKKISVRQHDWLNSVKHLDLIAFTSGITQLPWKNWTIWRCVVLWQMLSHCYDIWYVCNLLTWVSLKNHRKHWSLLLHWFGYAYQPRAHLHAVAWVLETTVEMLISRSERALIAGSTEERSLGVKNMAQSYDFTEEEIRRKLEELGYSHIQADKLKQFQRGLPTLCVARHFDHAHLLMWLIVLCFSFSSALQAQCLFSSLIHYNVLCQCCKWFWLPLSCMEIVLRTNLSAKLSLPEHSNMRS